MIDYSTLNIKKLKMFPKWSNPGTYHLQDGMGNGCAGDPPGYPTYFTRSVYTHYGNSPRKGAQMVISYEGSHYIVEHSKDWDNVKDWDGYHDKVQARLKSLYIPLPIDHPRVIAWINERFSHLNHCYYHPTLKEGNRRQIVIFPIPSYELRSFHDDERFSDEWRQKEKASIDQANKEIIAEREKVCTIDNHCAVVSVRKVYPDYIPDLQTIKHPKKSGNWYEMEDNRPDPDKCPGQYGVKHPVNESWCQYCGWKKGE